jgi:PAS domain S-box-containing protein
MADAPGDKPDRAAPESLSLEHYRFLVEQAADFIVELDLDGSFRYVSPGIQDTLGWQPAELVGRSAAGFVHPDDRERVGREYQGLSDGRSGESVHRARHRDGGWRWIQDIARLVRAPDGQRRVVAVGRDVTEKQELEARLERQAAGQALLCEVSRRFLGMRHREIPAGIEASLWVAAELAGVDRATLIVTGQDGSPIGSLYTWARPGAESLPPRREAERVPSFRWTTRLLVAGEAVVVPSLAALPPEAAAERQDLCERGVGSLLAIPASAGEQMIGYQILESAGLRRWTSHEIMLLRLLGEIFASAIQRMRSEGENERQLRAEARVAALSRRLLALKSDEIGDAVLVALRETAELARADRSCLYVPSATLAAEAAYHEWCAEGVEPLPPTPLPWSTAKVLAGETYQVERADALPPEAAAEREVLLRRGMCSALGIPVGSGPRIIGFLGFESRQPRVWSEQECTLLRVIGELLTAALRRKHAEEALRSSRAQLLQAQKLEAVGRLAGGIAHDFNNLLTVILGVSRPLVERLDAADPIRADLAEIQASAERAAALTRQLLTFSRRQPVSSCPVDLSRVVAGLEHMLRRLLGEDVLLETELAPDLGLVEIDPHQLEQVILNIAVNARDAMPDGGRLCLRTERRELGALEAGRMGLRRAGSHVVLAASDSGCGLDEETRARIFDPSFTTKEPGKGTGLGLAIAYSVVAQAGGAISVASAPGQGATFEVVLPRLAGALAPRPGQPRAAREDGRGCVLVVEDEPSVRRLVRRTLERRGYRVLEAENGEHALSVADRHLREIDVVLTDVVMPRLGGAELARRLRARRADLEMVFVSGYPLARGDAGAAAPLPDGPLLQKPFTEEELLASLRSALSRRDREDGHA